MTFDFTSDTPPQSSITWDFACLKIKPISTILWWFSLFTLAIKCICPWPYLQNISRICSATLIQTFDPLKPQLHSFLIGPPCSCWCHYYNSHHSCDFQVPFFQGATHSQPVKLCSHLPRGPQLCSQCRLERPWVGSPCGLPVCLLPLPGPLPLSHLPLASVPLRSELPHLSLWLSLSRPLFKCHLLRMAFSDHWNVGLMKVQTFKNMPFVSLVQCHVPSAFLSLLPPSLSLSFL